MILVGLGGGQTEVVDVEGTRAIFYNMELDSYQDTFLIHYTGKLVYFRDSLIQGQTDFNWSYGTVYYTNCQINCPDVEAERSV
jgi:pectin methylesterase-like acyl-CoA thioesterase